MTELTSMRVEQRDRIAIVTLMGRSALTVLNSALLRELGDCFERIRTDASVSAVILTGEGKAFAAGADIKEMQAMAPSEAEAFSGLGTGIFAAIAAHPVPVIAAVNGLALGGGLELALAADFIYASQSARFGLPEATLGLIPGFAGCSRLSDRIGMHAAKELIFTGRIVSAEEAMRLGIVNRVTAPDALLAQSLQTCSEIAAVSGNAVRTAKKVLGACAHLTPAEVTAVEIRQFGAAFSHDDARTGMSAFIAKTTPVWKDKP